MSRIKCLICILIALFAIEKGVYAQHDTTFYSMKWYTVKSVALDSARKQGKQVLLVWGRTTCGNTQGVMRRLSEGQLKYIVNNNYILWFSDCDKYRRFSDEVSDYLANMEARIELPAICIIDTYDVKVGHGLTTGPKYVDELLALLNQYVGNDNIDDKTGEQEKVYVAGNNIVIKSNKADEVISVFTITGTLIDRFAKSEYYMTRDISKYSKGILLVCSSSGWSQKIIK